MPRVHINIPVSNLEASIAFYSKVFGTEPSKQRIDYANFRLDEPALHLALVHKPDFTGNDPAFDNGQHFGIELFEDTDLSAWKDRVKTAGVLPHLEEEDVTCCYAVADKFWLRDPDGNEWEFWVRHDDEGETLFSSTEASACCAPAKPEPVETDCCPSTPSTVNSCC